MDGISADRFADGPTAHARGSPVDAAPHARVHDVVRDVLERCVGFDHARRGGARQRDGDAGLGPEHVLEHLLRGAGVGRVAGDVIGKARRDEQRRPRRIGVGGRVAVGVGRANGCDRPPLAVGELRVPGCDERIGAGQVEQRERAGILRQRQAAARWRPRGRRDSSSARRSRSRSERGRSDPGCG